jgi:hypothetical protein
MALQTPSGTYTVPDPIARNAVNTAADSENKIHSDAEARRFGYAGALVPGVTLYAYLTQLAVQFFGAEWLNRGSASLRVSRPVYAGETVQCVADMDRDDADRVRLVGDAPVLHASCLRPDGKTAATLNASLRDTGVDALAGAPDLPEIAPPQPLPRLTAESVPLGRTLAPLDTPLTADFARSYATETEDPCPWWRDPSPFGYALLPPGVIAARQAHLLRQNFTFGPSIHAGSEIQHLAPAPANGRYRTGGVIREAFERNGHHYLVLDALTTAEGVPVARIRHTSIFQVRAS